jgi:hypothetical protein
MTGSYQWTAACGRVRGHRPAGGRLGVLRFAQDDPLGAESGAAGAGGGSRASEARRDTESSRAARGALVKRSWTEEIQLAWW